MATAAEEPAAVAEEAPEAPLPDLVVPVHALQGSPHPLFTTENIPPAAPDKVWILPLWCDIDGTGRNLEGNGFLELGLDTQLPELLQSLRDSADWIPYLLKSCGVWLGGRRMKATGDTLRSLGVTDGQTVVLCWFEILHLTAAPAAETSNKEDTEQKSSESSPGEEEETTASLSSEDLRSLDAQAMEEYACDLPVEVSPNRDRVVSPHRRCPLPLFLSFFPSHGSSG